MPAQVPAVKAVWLSFRISVFGHAELELFAERSVRQEA